MRCIGEPDESLRDALARAAEKNLSVLADLSGKWIERVHGRRPPKVARHGFPRQPDAWRTGKQRLEWALRPATAVRVQSIGDLQRCALRPGNVHSADGWDGVLKSAVARYAARSRASISVATPASPIQMSTSSSNPK